MVRKERHHTHMLPAVYVPCLGQGIVFFQYLEDSGIKVLADTKREPMMSCLVWIVGEKLYIYLMGGQKIAYLRGYRPR